MAYDPYVGVVTAARQKAAALDAARLDPFSIDPMQGDIEPFQRVKLVVTFAPHSENPSSGFASQKDLYVTRRLICACARLVSSTCACSGICACGGSTL